MLQDGTDANMLVRMFTQRTFLILTLIACTAAGIFVAVQSLDHAESETSDTTAEPAITARVEQPEPTTDELKSVPTEQGDSAVSATRAELARCLAVKDPLTRYRRLRQCATDCAETSVETALTLAKGLSGQDRKAFLSGIIPVWVLQDVSATLAFTDEAFNMWKSMPWLVLQGRAI